ncbi:putative membrane protein [Burkholderia sp. Ch1-1]|uniref:Putative integral membrane protein n=1 Tax=Paraburkholderia dioscoreae TaxID=2604047 RepID=A0A5Q4Z3E6_9BURK|nr:MULTISPECIES: DUF969 domain-containing protein [Paraburkholderia]EIF34348.1 putative membrane protein [Burkholderia sp. Ch1-1]MDR8395215.1 DUF969 domain-containing protein [Paraburkholderia sp. USG1]VVD33284.1 putative integral membrane protein [Paraburkholderia dioscoreae]
MHTAVNLWPLVGVAVIVIGFALRINPMLVVVGATVVTGVLASMPLIAILTQIGTGFVKTRNLPLIIILPLAVIGLLERYGLREQAQNWISGVRAATAGRLLICYLAVRELSAALGLVSLGGHAQMVRPLIAPMAEGAAVNRHGPLSDELRNRVRAFAAATDNVGLFFGEDIFVAFGGIMLMHTLLTEMKIDVSPIAIAFWGLPTALAAFLIHAVRLYRLDGYLARAVSQSQPTTRAAARLGTPVTTTPSESKGH